jgi:hypothetical protein
LQILWTPSNDDNEKEAYDTNSDCSIDSYGLYDDYEDDCDTKTDHPVDRYKDDFIDADEKERANDTRVIIPLFMSKMKFLMLHFFCITYQGML